LRKPISATSPATLTGRRSRQATINNNARKRKHQLPHAHRSSRKGKQSKQTAVPTPPQDPTPQQETSEPKNGKEDQARHGQRRHHNKITKTDDDEGDMSNGRVDTANIRANQQGIHGGGAEDE
jgi:hypothetical protein